MTRGYHYAYFTDDTLGLAVPTKRVHVAIIDGSYTISLPCDLGKVTLPLWAVVSGSETEANTQLHGYL